jgi:hypothetical protein
MENASFNYLKIISLDRNATNKKYTINIPEGPEGNVLNRIKNSLENN